MRKVIRIAYNENNEQVGFYVFDSRKNKHEVYYKDKRRKITKYLDDAINYMAKYNLNGIN